MSDQTPIRHEQADVATRPLLWFAAGLVALVVGSAAALDFMFGHPLPAMQQVAIIGPALQEQPAADFAVFNATQTARLHSLAWVDRAHGLARIPVDEAMRMIARDGLPDRRPVGCLLAAATSPEECAP